MTPALGVPPAAKEGVGEHNASDEGVPPESAEFVRAAEDDAEHCEDAKVPFVVPERAIGGLLMAMVQDGREDEVKSPNRALAPSAMSGNAVSPGPSTSASPRCP